MRIAVVCDDLLEDGEPPDRLAAERCPVQVDGVERALGRRAPFERVGFRGDAAAFVADVERTDPSSAVNLRRARAAAPRGCTG